MKKKILLLLPLSFMLCSCSIGEFFSGLFNNNQQEEKQKPKEIDDNPPSEIVIHANSLKTDDKTPTAPFTMRLGEVRNLGVKFDPTPTRDEEKIVTWQKQGSSVEYVVSETDTKQITVTAVSTGKTILRATSTYDDALIRDITINVIDFDEENDYMWTYSSSIDRAKFGYINKDRNEGLTSGSVDLEGIKWDYERSEATSLQSAYGSIGFGKGDSPETHIHFETYSERNIEYIVLEVGSARSLAKMSVKVGETVFMNEAVVPEVTNNTLTGLKAEADEPAKGKVEIDIYTPEYDPLRAEDETYLHPGAFYLKSMMIHYSEPATDRSIELVKDASEIKNGCRYLIVGDFGSKFMCLDGERTTSVKENPFNIENFTKQDTELVDKSFYKHGFIATIDINGKLNFTSVNSTSDGDKIIKVGLTDSGGLSTAGSPKKLGWDYTFDENHHFILSRENPADASAIKYFGTKTSGSEQFAFASVDDAPENIYLYKF